MAFPLANGNCCVKHCGDVKNKIALWIGRPKGRSLLVNVAISGYDDTTTCFHKHDSQGTDRIHTFHGRLHVCTRNLNYTCHLQNHIYIAYTRHKTLLLHRTSCHSMCTHLHLLKKSKWIRRILRGVRNTISGRYWKYEYLSTKLPVKTKISEVYRDCYDWVWNCCSVNFYRQTYKDRERKRHWQIERG